MKIDSAAVHMASQYHSLSVHQVEESRVFRWARDEAAPTPGVSVRVSELAQEILSEAQASDAAQAPHAANSNGDDALSFGVRLLLRAVELLLGRKLDLAVPAGPGLPADSPEQPAVPMDWSVQVHRREIIHEEQAVAFRATGWVRTGQGQEIQFSFGLDMQRVFHSQSETFVQAGGAQRKDPLVVNLDGGPVGLSNVRFEFDLDGDGTTESLPALARGSGFLALDLDGNGVIDDGTELFGVHSGDGFADLAAYDEDGNGWIDENDLVFSRLRIWTHDAQGEAQLSTLGEHNIGALYLGRTATPFSIRDGANTPQAEVLSTGLYLREDGRAGSLQQIDFYI